MTVKYQERLKYANKIIMTLIMIPNSSEKFPRIAGQHATTQELTTGGYLKESSANLSRNEKCPFLQTVP